MVIVLEPSQIGASPSSRDTVWGCRSARRGWREPAVRQPELRAEMPERLGPR